MYYTDGKYQENENKKMYAFKMLMVKWKKKRLKMGQTIIYL